MDRENEVPSYRKKKESNTSKAKFKSKHPHEYVDCLFIKGSNPHKGTYCHVCGKIGDMKFFETEKTDKGFCRQLDKDEVFAKYKDLERIEIDDVFQKFVSVTEK